jgi:riboflavin synthase
MFTGIITEIGNVESVRKQGGGVQLSIKALKSSRELKINDSVAINGVCQTVISKSDGMFVVEAVEETLKKTTLGTFKKGFTVNLELAMKLNDRLGGHIVLGHVDTTGKIVNIENNAYSKLYAIQFPIEYKRYVVPVGSIAIDGVSLTIAEVTKNKIKVSIIPHTLQNTLFDTYKKNDIVNIEFDIVGKYIQSMLTSPESKDKAKSQLTVKHLHELGY